MPGEMGSCVTSAQGFTVLDELTAKNALIEVHRMAWVLEGVGGEDFLEPKQSVSANQVSIRSGCNDETQLIFFFFCCEATPGVKRTVASFLISCAGFRVFARLACAHRTQ